MSTPWNITLPLKGKPDTCYITLVNQEGITLSEVRHSQSDRYQGIPFNEASKGVKFRETESRVVSTRDWGRGGEEETSGREVAGEGCLMGVQ